MEETFVKTAFKMFKTVILIFLTLVLSTIFTSAGPLNKRQIYKYKNNDRNARDNNNRIQKEIDKSNNNLRWKRLEAKKARLELIDEMLKFYWDTLEVFFYISFYHIYSIFLNPCNFG